MYRDEDTGTEYPGAGLMSGRNPHSVRGQGIPGVPGTFKTGYKGDEARITSIRKRLDKHMDELKWLYMELTTVRICLKGC